MAIVTGTTLTYGVGSAGGNREDLSDRIYDLFPDDTYFLTNLDKVSASATLHEWLGDTIVAPGSNINREGNEGEFSSIVSPIRYANYTQIFKKEFVVSDTQEQVSKAGRRREGSRQTVKQMRELKNDVEWAMVRNQLATAGGSGTGRALGSMENWIGAGRTASATVATSHVLATAGTSATTAAISSKVPGAVTDASAGSGGAITAANLDLALEGAWAQGGTTDCIAVSASVKSTINTFTGVATRNVELNKTGQAIITGAADIYVSSFGVHKILLHRHVRANVALCIDSDLWAVASLRDFFMERLAKTGDGHKYAIRYEGTLESRNYLGNSKVSSIA
ncbi:MAG: SU10 major capsid protein [Planctomycetota bacterium]|jgi:hypothetical protein